MPASCEKDVQAIAKSLEKMIAGKKEMDSAVELIDALSKLPVTLEIISKMHLEMTINDLRKKTTDERLSRKAKSLIRVWRDLPDTKPSTSKIPKFEQDQKGSRDSPEKKSRDSRSSRSSNGKSISSYTPMPVNHGDEMRALEKSGDGDNKKSEEEEREKPNFVPSGKLTAETNTFKGVVIKYNEPPEAKICKARWRMYPFKGTEQLPVIYIHRQSAYLIGRERKISDFPIDHPSCSKQHAVIQYRSMPYQRADGSRARRTLPYIIDLGSANGTYLNNERIEAERYYELKEQDVLKFGFSSREYVLLKELDEESRHAGDRDPDEDDLDVLNRTGLEDHEEESGTF